MTKKFLVKTIIQQEVWDLVEATSIPDAVSIVEQTEKDPFVYTTCHSYVKSVTEIESWEDAIKEFHPTITENYIDSLVKETIIN
jgi:hypothetical protein